jgi:hypothetical protein
MLIFDRYFKNLHQQTLSAHLSLPTIAAKVIIQWIYEGYPE